MNKGIIRELFEQHILVKIILIFCILTQKILIYNLIFLENSPEMSYDCFYGQTIIN